MVQCNRRNETLDQAEKQFLILAICNARSPKLALNGAKLVYHNDESWGEISKACFERAWEDAGKRNLLIEKSGGKVRWPERFDLDKERIADEANKITSSKNKSYEWGVALSTYDATTLLSIRSLVELP